jgi:membrane protein DedA with SNARE-associated domain
MSDWMTQLVDQLGYLGVALLMLLETVFPPIPSEVIMPLAGVKAARGSLSLVGVVAAGSVGAMLGNALWFAAARALGIERLRSFIERHGRWLTIDWHDVERGERTMKRGGRWFVCLGRLVPTVRSIVSIPAGLLRMSWPSFLLWSTIGTVGWTALLAGAGALLGQRFRDVEAVTGPIATGVLVLLLFVYVWRVVRWRRSRD